MQFPQIQETLHTMQLSGNDRVGSKTLFQTIKNFDFFFLISIKEIVTMFKDKMLNCFLLSFLSCVDTAMALSLKFDAFFVLECQVVQQTNKEAFF